MRTTRYRSYGGGGGGGVPGECPPTAVFADTFAVKDDLAVRATLFDTFAATDNLGVVTKLFDTLGADDRLAFAALALAHVDTFGAADFLSAIELRFPDLFRDTFGMDDRLTFADILSTYADTVGTDDSLRVLPLAMRHLDSFGADDRPSFFDVFSRQDDTVGMSDGTLGVTAKALLDTFGVADAPSLFTPKPIYADTFGNDDAFTKAQFRQVVFGRSATPDSDPSGDAGVYQENPTGNDGAGVSSPVKGKSTLANDEKRALLEFDFTRYANMTAFAGGTHVLSLLFGNSQPLLSVDITVQLSRLASRPFVESTVTWNNQPAAGTVIKSQVFTIPANSNLLVQLALTDAQMNDLLGNWGYVRCTGPGAAAPVEAQVQLRENNVDQRPRWDFDLKR